MTSITGFEERLKWDKSDSIYGKVSRINDPCWPVNQ